MGRIQVGTTDGVRVFEDDRAIETELAQRRVSALAREGAERWAILDDREVRRTGAGAWTAASVSALNVDLPCIASTAAGVLVGVGGAHLARVTDKGLETVVAFDRVEGRERWYTPWGGPPDVRSIAEDDVAVYVNVHVGGIVRSRDAGETWEPTIDVDADVHRVWAGEPGVFAACARGLAHSGDRGGTWTMRDDGLHAGYCRAVTVCGDTVLLSASTGPRGGRAALYRGSLAGGPFERCSTGLPDWLDANIDSAWLDATPELAAFGTADGRVFASTDEGASWAELAAGLPGIACVLVSP